MLFSRRVRCTINNNSSQTRALDNFTSPLLLLIAVLLTSLSVNSAGLSKDGDKAASTLNLVNRSNASIRGMSKAMRVVGTNKSTFFTLISELCIHRELFSFDTLCICTQRIDSSPLVLTAYIGGEITLLLSNLGAEQGAD